MASTPSGTTQTTVAVPSDFQFPPQYSFPPFFTLQPNLTTRASQLLSWSVLIQSYCRHKRVFSLSLIDAINSDLFQNVSLNRRLNLRDAKVVVDWMCSKDGGQRAEWFDKRKGKDEAEGGRFWVYWRRPEEWAGVIEDWVDATGQKGTVLTLYEIAEGDGTLGQEFHGIESDLLHRSLQMSVKRGKAQIFGQEDQLGIKFF